MVIVWLLDMMALTEAYCFLCGFFTDFLES